MIISLRRMNKLLETWNPLECLGISPTNINGFNVRLWTGQYNEKFPRKEYVVYPVLLHLLQFFSFSKWIFVSNPQALFWQTKPLGWAKNSFFIRPSINWATWNAVVLFCTTWSTFFVNWFLSTKKEIYDMKNLPI